MRIIAISLSLCPSVCSSVSLSTSISLESLDRSSRNFFCDPLWPWLGPPPVALRHVLYFWFYGWRHVSSVAIPGQSLMSMDALFILQILLLLHFRVSSLHCHNHHQLWSIDTATQSGSLSTWTFSSNVPHNTTPFCVHFNYINSQSQPSEIPK